jgi:polyhydroxyalkanoate synthase
LPQAIEARPQRDLLAAGGPAPATAAQLVDLADEHVLAPQPKNSFIKWCVDQGHTTFVISWVNPRTDLAHKHFEDYLLEGPLAALDAIQQATGEREANILGFCIGGILTAGALGYLAAKGEGRIKSATFLASLFDFREAGEVSVFIDD